MLSPEYLSDVPTSMVTLYEQVEQDILSDMARRINEYDYWIPAAEHQATVLEEMGIVREEIIEKLAAKTTLSQTELKNLMKESAWYALESDDSVYARAGLTPSPISASKELQSILSAGYSKTNATFSNLVRTTAVTGSNQFRNALDKAYMQITMGGMDYNTAIRNAIKELSKDGLGAVTYASGKVDSLEVAVRRATITGVNQTALQLQEARAEEMGCDLVEVSAHAGARLEHAMWQGEVYSRSGTSKEYKGLVEATGYGTGAGLGGWNCSHGFSPYFEGSPRTYSKEQLEDYKAKNYTYNGKAMTEYEALQEQRNIERNIRKWKREQVAMEVAGQSIDDTAVKLKAWQAREDDFLKQTGLKRASDRTSVGGYGKSQATKATNAAKRVANGEKSGIIEENIVIPRTLSAAAFRDTVLIPDLGKKVTGKIVEGTEITKVVTFAGKGTNKQIKVAKHLEDQFGVIETEWKKVRGDGYVEYPDGTIKHVELHWFESKDTGRIKMKVKRVFANES
ncbi:phage minor capsid protein [Chakrabartyella piscis]|uniref:phage minor capsid protein n=1 Tax=Chakrabartyella piscis TaxID=2918914 RepID=UPI0029585F16|nr:phage minor capsid protein [Chakrabartyella piscis]